MARLQRDIKTDVKSEIFWDLSVPADDIKIEMSDQDTIVLNGSVPTFSARKKAELDALSVWGVKEVDNRLVVKYPAQVPADNAIKDNIVSLLDISANYDIEDIQVSVTGGKATIEGKVDAYWQRVHAENLISDVIGVTDVNNLLVVVPKDSIVDEVIAKEVMDAMKRKQVLEAEDINVVVKDGDVILSGEVNSYTAWSEAYDSAVYTAGVKSIDDNIEIEYPTSV